MAQIRKVIAEIAMGRQRLAELVKKEQLPLATILSEGDIEELSLPGLPDFISAKQLGIEGATRTSAYISVDAGLAVLDTRFVNDLLRGDIPIIYEDEEHQVADKIKGVNMESDIHAFELNNGLIFQPEVVVANLYNRLQSAEVGKPMLKAKTGPLASTGDKSKNGKTE